MLTGLHFMLALVGVIVVVIWEITNDGAGLTEETQGLLKMRKEQPMTTGDGQE
jgi:hypothetical protein